MLFVKGRECSKRINGYLTRDAVSIIHRGEGKRETTPPSIQSKINFLNIQIMKDNAVKGVKTIGINSSVGKARHTQQVTPDRHATSGSKYGVKELREDISDIVRHTLHQTKKMCYYCF